MGGRNDGLLRIHKHAAQIRTGFEFLKLHISRSLKLGEGFGGVEARLTCNT